MRWSRPSTVITKTLPHCVVGGPCQALPQPYPNAPPSSIAPPILQPCPPSLERAVEVGLWVRRKAEWETGSASCSPAGPDQRILYTVLECQPLFDSSDMTITEWVQIAQTIEVEGGGVGRAECGAVECGWSQKAGLDWKVGL